MVDGHRSICKDCDNADRRRRYAANRAVYKTSYSKWRKEHQDTILEITRATRAKHPEKKPARDKLYKAVASGTIIKPRFCEECWKELPLDGHHPDYSKPLDVIWLCRSCHNFHHRKDKS